MSLYQRKKRSVPGILKKEILSPMSRCNEYKSIIIQGAGYKCLVTIVLVKRNPILNVSEYLLISMKFLGPFLILDDSLISTFLIKHISSISANIYSS